MKKISFIRLNNTKFGGAEIYLSRLVSVLDKEKIPYEIINSSLPKKLSSWIKVLLFNFSVCKNKKGRFYFSLERISCPDIYRAGDGVHKVFLKIEKKSKLNPLHLVYLNLEKKAFINAKKIIAISEIVKNDIINAYNIDKNKIEVIYNGINLKKIDYQKSFKILDLEYSLEEKEKVFVYVGSGFKRKGVEEFLIILSLLKYKNFKAFIIGKEKNLLYYKTLAKRLSLDKKVIFTGPRRDVNDFYTIADIFLFPTRYEPFGNVILEAMNFLNAVITTKQCGGGELLDNEFIMNDSKDYSIVELIDSLLMDSVKLEKIKKRNLELVKNFSIEKNVEETLKVINEVIN